MNRWAPREMPPDMSPQEKIANIKARFVNGALPLDELLLHFEPVLRDAMLDDEKAANKLVNAIERAMFTLNEPQRANAIVECLDLAIALLARR